MKNKKRKIATIAVAITILGSIYNNKMSNKNNSIKYETTEPSTNPIETFYTVPTETTRPFDPRDIFTTIDRPGFIKNTTTVYNWYNEEKSICGSIDAFQKVYLISTNGEYTFALAENNEAYYIPNENIELLPDSYIESDLSDKITTLAYEKEIIGKFTVSIGAPDTPTDEGYFEIKGKDYNRYLDGPGYHTYVNYFFYYNGGDGFHNLPGYTTFGEEVSHGCTRMRDEDIKLMDKYVYVGMKVLVHK